MEILKNYSFFNFDHHKKTRHLQEMTSSESNRHKRMAN